jgi:fumarate reductase flavoprotein subunit
MWEKVGIIRDAAGLRAGLSELQALESDLGDAGIANGNRAFNLTWHDWLNLKSLVQTSRVIAEAAFARTDSRGAHFREDFPEAGPLEQSAYTSVRQKDGASSIGMKPVAFTRVRPGESLLGESANHAPSRQG